MWLEITAVIARDKLNIPAALAGDPACRFYVHVPFDTLPPYGPWPVVAVRRPAENPPKATLMVATVEEEHLQMGGIDPFAYPAGYLSLGKTAVRSLADLLQTLAAELPPSGSHAGAFTPVTGDEVTSLGLQRWVFADHTQAFYRQHGRPGSSVTLLYFSAPDPQPSDALFFTIARFAPHATDPISAAEAKIDLDREGFSELAELFSSEMTHLAEDS